MFCRQCGFKLSDNAKFCRNCGTKVEVVELGQNTWIPPQPQPVMEEQPKVQPQPVMEEQPKVQPQPVMEEQPKVQPQPVVEEEPEYDDDEIAPVPNMPVPDKVEKKKKGHAVLIVIEIIIVIILLVAIAVGGFLLYQDKTGGNFLKDIMGKFGKETTEEMIEDESGEASADEADESAVVTELQGMVDNGEYEEAISKILALDEETIEASKDGIKSVMQAAVDGHMEEAFSDADSLAGEGDYKDAFKAIENEKTYREGLVKEDFASEYVSDNQALEDKMNDMLEKYQSFVIEEATSMANQGNTEEVQSIFRDADEYLSGDDYEDNKTRVYTKLVRNRISTMQLNGESAYTVLQYINSNLELVDNDCWVLEFWDYFNALYEMENGTSTNSSVTHQNADGYLLPDSDTRELSMSDLDGFSEMECRLARYEIYARHGRGFNDQAVTAFFSKYGWYQESVSPEDFDEFSLNEYEKKNRDLIIQYEKEHGYR